MIAKPRTWVGTNRLFLFFIVITFCGCSTLGDVPSALRVDKGDKLELQDEQVRFKTTYYFRVADSCKVEDGIGDNTEKNDKTYRQELEVFNVRKKGVPKIVNDSF